MSFFSGFYSEGNESESATTASEEKATNYPQAAHSGVSGWISGLIYGAGNLISSFLDSEIDSSNSSSYSSYSTNDVVDCTSEQADEVSSKQSVELMQIVKDSEPVKDFYGGAIAIISGIESKDAIKQLLMQETFSRNEYNKLAKIIQSRVIDFRSAEVGGDGVQKEPPCRSFDNAMSSKMNVHSLNKNGKLPETVSVSSAVMEASKWLEQNNFASRSKYNCYLGTCSLNAHVLQHDCEGEACSPVNLAKTYMRSLQPLHSTRRSTNRFQTMPSPWRHHYKDEPQCKAASNSTAVLKASKRSYRDLGSWHAFENYRRVRIKPLNASDIEDKDLDRSISLKDEACNISSEAVHNCTDVLGLTSSSYRSSQLIADLSEELNVKECYLARPCKVLDLEAPGTSHPSKGENNASLNSISDCEQPVLPVQLCVRNSSQQTNCTVDDNTMLHNHVVVFVDGNQVNEKLPEIIQQGSSCSLHSLPFNSMKYDGILGRSNI